MMLKQKVLISGIAVAVIGAVVVFAMSEWFSQEK